MLSATCGPADQTNEGDPQSCPYGGLGGLYGNEHPARCAIGLVGMLASVEINRH